jgi:hypothetical protein
MCLKCQRLNSVYYYIIVFLNNSQQFIELLCIFCFTDFEKEVNLIHKKNSPLNAFRYIFIDDYLKLSENQKILFDNRHDKTYRIVNFQ